LRPTSLSIESGCFGDNIDKIPSSQSPLIENNRTIAIERFVPRAQIDPRYHDTPYYITPREQMGQEAFAVIRDAMRGKEMVGMGRVILTKRERPIILEPLGSGIRGMTLRYAHEVRSEAEYFADIPSVELPDEMLRIAEHILETKRADFDPALLEDRYRTVLVEMLRGKQAEMPQMIGAAASSRGENIVNLMDALKRSLTAERSAARTSVPKSRLDGPPFRQSNARKCALEDRGKRTLYGRFEKLPGQYLPSIESMLGRSDAPAFKSSRYFCQGRLLGFAHGDASES